MNNCDKQIIFDDVDVKDCIAYAKSQTVYLGNTAYKQMEKVCMVKNQPCKFFDCQFKQIARELKAKEQECSEYSKELARFQQEVVPKLRKRLRNKEQECERLKSDYFTVIQQRNVAEQQLEAYKMEAEEGKEINAELKAELTRANCQIADDEILQCDMREAIEELKAENEKLKKAYQRLNNMYNDNCNFTGKLEQTLTEIKEIAEMQCVCGVNCQDMKIIRQKISECEGNNEYS